MMLESLRTVLPFIILGVGSLSSPASGQVAGWGTLLAGLGPARATETAGTSLPPASAGPFPGDTLPVDTLSPVVLKPLVVSVLRSPTLLSEAPFSVSLLDSADLDLPGGATSLEEALRGVPGLQVQSRYNPALGERVTLRGAGARTQFGVRGLYLMVDGIPATLPDGQSTLDHLDLASLGRIEVLRGPASALFGNGAASAVSFTTVSPPDGTHEQDLAATVGSYGHRQAHLRFSGTSSAVGYVLSLGWMDLDGFRTDPTGPRETYGSASRKILNGTLRIPAGAGTLSATINHLDLTAENPGSIGRENLQQGSLDSHPFNVIQDAGKDVRQTQGGLSWAGGRGSRTGTLAGYVLARSVKNPIPPALVNLDRVSGGVRGSIEQDGRWGPVRLRLALGGEAARQADSRKNFENVEGTPGSTVLDQQEDVLSTSLSLRGVADLPNRANVMAALRLDRVRFRVRDRLVTGADPNDSGSRVLVDLTPAVGAFVPVSSFLGVRASFSRFFQTPTTSELANQPSGAGGFNSGLEPQQGTGLEVGFRYAPFRLFHSDFTLFLNRIRNELVPFQVPLVPGRTFFRNAGRSRHRGYEWAAWISPPGHWSLQWTYSYLDAHFVEFATDDGDFHGNRIPGVPRHALEGIVSWVDPGGGKLGDPMVELSALYRSSIPVDDANTAYAPPFARFDLRVGLRGLEAGGVTWDPFLRIENLLDRNYASSVTVNAFGGRYFEPGSPRAVYVGLAAAF